MAISVEKKGAENNDNALNKKEAALIKNRKAQPASLSEPLFQKVLHSICWVMPTTIWAKA